MTITDEVTPEVTDTTNITVETPNTSAATETMKVKRDMTNAIAKRSALADHRKAEEAVELLRSKGFTVTYPERWEHPDVQTRRDQARKAVEALRAAGVDADEIKALLGDAQTEDTTE